MIQHLPWSGMIEQKPQKNVCDSHGTNCTLLTYFTLELCSFLFFHLCWKFIVNVISVAVMHNAFWCKFAPLYNVYL